MSDEILPPIDRENLFLLFSTFSCDVERTAHAAGLRPIDVLRVADECGWLERLKSIVALKKSSSPGEIERQINRAITFAQAHRMRMLIDKAVTRLTNMSDDELSELLFVPDKFGIRKLTTRPLCDLAAAAEKANAQAAMALCDTSQDRSRREESLESTEAAGTIHAQIAAACAAIGKDCSTRAVLIDAQLAQAQEIIKTVEKPENPADNDDH